MRKFINDMLFRIREYQNIIVHPMFVIFLSLPLLWQDYILWQNCAPIRKTHMYACLAISPTLFPCEFMLCNSDVTRCRNDGWDESPHLPPLSLFLSLSLSLPLSLCSWSEGIMRNTRSAIRGDRLLWRAYCFPLAGIVSEIQWSGPVRSHIHVPYC